MQQRTRSPIPARQTLELRLIDNARTASPRNSLTDLEITQRQEELERAQDRVQECKSLVAAIAADVPRDATLSRVLRKAVIEQGRRQDECEALPDRDNIPNGWNGPKMP